MHSRITRRGLNVPLKALIHLGCISMPSLTQKRRLVMRIYLNFDGVLNCIPKHKGHFEHLPVFEAVLRTHRKVEVIISSSYRELLPIAVMRTFFSTDTRHQIVGITPVLPGCKRVDEIRAHVKATGYCQRFIVLDDAPVEFPRHYPPLILCQTTRGLGERELTELLNRLARKYD